MSAAERKVQRAKREETPTLFLVFLEHAV